MPTYDYECENCGHTFEHYQSFSEKNLRKCPECKKSKLIRLIGMGCHCHVENVTTVGQLGERNFKKLGKYGVDNLAEQNKDMIEHKKAIRRNKEILKNPKKYIEEGRT